MNGLYWGLTALALMGHQEALPKDEVVSWVMSCWQEDVGKLIKLLCLIAEAFLFRD